MDSENIANNPIEVESTPLWRYVTKLEKIGSIGAGGNIEFQCHFCQIKFKGTYSRVRAHLLRLPGVGIRACSKITSSSLLEVQRKDAEAEQRKKNTAFKKVPLPSAGQSTSSQYNSSQSSAQLFRMDGYDPKKRKASGNTAIEKAFNLATRDHLHAEIARMFYSAALPFHLARNPYYFSAFSYAANNVISGYVPPGYNLLRTTLLQKERANLEKLLQPIKETWIDKGVTIACDGWTDAQRRPLINFMAVAESGPMFVKAINCEGAYKDKFFIANEIKEVILGVGAEKVVQVITDNAPVCRAAGVLIETQFPHIFWTSCVVHTLNLAFKNICAPKNVEGNEVTFEQCSWINDIAGDVSAIKNFIMNHSMRLSMFNEHVKLKLMAVAETRFASVIVMLRRIKEIKSGLQSMVISERWSMYREDDMEKARFAKEKILDDLWWDKIDFIIDFTEPIYDMLRVADTDRPCLHLVYDMWDSMIEKVKGIIYHHEGRRDYEESPFYKVVFDILVQRWNKSNTPLHCLAHSLNPRYYSQSWLSECTGRVAPHKDMEISNERNKCLKRIFPNLEERCQVNLEFANFFGYTGVFADHDSIASRGTMDGIAWWMIYGASSPKLQSLAFKLLAQPCSSSCCERNWSTYSFINSLKRNKITPQRGEDLVFVHTNLRLLSRKSPAYTQGETKFWDIGGDTVPTMDDIGLLEVANLSLDEPSLETVFFLDEGEGEEIVEESNEASTSVNSNY